MGLCKFCFSNETLKTDPSKFLVVMSCSKDYRIVQTRINHISVELCI